MTDSDAYRELGYLPPEEIGEVKKTLNRLKERGADPDQMAARNIGILKELKPDLEWNGTGTVILEFLGRKIDFHPASNTYYLHSKGQFGYGIEKQVRIIQEYLKGKSNDSPRHD